MIPSKDDRTIAADELNAGIYTWGQIWNINFEPAKCCTLCVSLKQDIDLPSILMATLLIDEVDVLKILGIHFDHTLLWSHMIDQLATHCRKHLGALYRIRDYLGRSGITTAFRLFVRPVCEYGGVLLWGPLLRTPAELDSVQQAHFKLHFHCCHLARKPVPSACYVNY